jgi:hypothetical protein
MGQEEFNPDRLRPSFLTRRNPVGIDHSADSYEAPRVDLLCRRRQLAQHFNQLCGSLQAIRALPPAALVVEDIEVEEYRLFLFTIYHLPFTRHFTSSATPSYPKTPRPPR